MRILLINQYFRPDVAATAQLLAELAEDLSAGGAEVTALTGRGSYVPGRAEKLPRREEWRGVEIRRVWCTSFGRKSTLGRLSDYLTFLTSAKLVVLFGRRRDVVVCPSTPLLVAVLGLLARLRGARFVCKVEELYPDVAIMLGTMHAGSLVARWSGALSRLLLRRADAVVALDEGMAAVLAERGAQRVVVIPNWADGRAIRPDPEAGALFRRNRALDGRFVVLYSGNLGLAHRFEEMVGAAAILSELKTRVLFLFVGGGPRLDEVRAATRDAPNVRFMPYQPLERLRALYAAADLHLVTLRDEVSGMVVPSKYPAALAAGKPVLLVGGRGTEMRREIERLGLGWCCDRDSEAVSDAIVEACRPSTRLEAMGAKARRLLEEKYERRLCTRRWAELIASVLDSKRSEVPAHT
ncbi:MAG: glycosyltransferase family 4 protein [Thermoanaerobaculaceae bacterium]